MSEPFSFRLQHVDPRCRARRGTFSTPHGPVEMPAFMPVGTQGTVKGLEIEMLRATGAQMILANTYHLALRPGEAIVEKLGGLHRFMGWDGPILTDSGGFQIFSLAANVKITEEQATFRSHLDGNLVELSPERAVAIQEALGSDVAMVLDHVVALPNSPEVLRDAAMRSVRWAERAKRAHRRADQAQFAIVQGGLDPKLRIECTEALAGIRFSRLRRRRIERRRAAGRDVSHSGRDRAGAARDQPRYLMGVGRPQDILEAIGPRNRFVRLRAANAQWAQCDGLYRRRHLRLRNQKFIEDPRPLEEGCPCPACRRSRGYLRHLFMADEMLGPILLTAHNVTYFQRLMSEVRRAIVENRFTDFKMAKLQGWSTSDKTAQQN